MSITATASENGNAVTISVTGRFDFSLHKDFRDAYRDKSPAAKYTIDMSNTEYMDSSALGMLLLLREHAGGDKSSIVISGCQPDIKKILTISNFQKLFEIN
jgi:anti-anti-sigma factor